ncbi:MAG: hypothetical protein JST01_05180 [Cyanobacteria bacterium SZAS TMP-1]|nr:hypothetical protein [Cyanobacteria bacterium SZAS TMP-1]
MRAAHNKSRVMPAILASLVFTLGGCSKENQNTIEGEVPAPGAAYSAVLFHRKADNLRTETENISIIRAGEVVLNDIGNIYSASREDTGKPQMLYINWRTPNTLQVFRNPATHAYKEEKHFECLTGIFIQTTPFEIEYGDYKDIHPAESTPQPSRTKKAAETKTSKKRRPK